MNTIINTSNAPAPIGPYNQAVLAGNFLYISGQIPVNATTGEMVTENIELETKQVMNNLAFILEEAGFQFSDVVKTSIFLSDMKLFAQVNDIYATYFNDNFPARETIAVKGLPKECNVEISMIAHKNQ
ncbi:MULTISPECIES: Rid family detoxifying hydrolase [Bacteroidota]|uniref:Rid family detoxifying hydrolase n=1 Tax=Bacteroidota TaxID=976 RepID=UPI001CBC09BF|nr:MULTISPECIES: Rid family detoxifying hydrolase [Bacteroidota]MBZ4190786.1 Rid family detoxifying hydrolase [Niabella beijingensis]UMQ40824.1 Rid family detoxifying hydrolase [Chryseobacterium sp. Y16C]